MATCKRCGIEIGDEYICWHCGGHEETYIQKSTFVSIESFMMPSEEFLKSWKVTIEEEDSGR